MSLRKFLAGLTRVQNRPTAVVETPQASSPDAAKGDDKTDDHAWEASLWAKIDASDVETIDMEVMPRPFSFRHKLDRLNAERRAIISYRAVLLGHLEDAQNDMSDIEWQIRDLKAQALTAGVVVDEDEGEVG